VDVSSSYLRERASSRQMPAGKGSHHRGKAYQFSAKLIPLRLVDAEHRAMAVTSAIGGGPIQIPIRSLH
jgi:hypothetical protein